VDQRLMPETSVIVGASLAVHYFSPRRRRVGVLGTQGVGSTYLPVHCTN
jgi:hypothetical protein